MQLYKTTYDTVVAGAKSGKVNNSRTMFNLMFQNLNSVKDKSYKKTVTINYTKERQGANGQLILTATLTSRCDDGWNVHSNQEGPGSTVAPVYRLSDRLSKQ